MRSLLVCLSFVTIAQLHSQPSQPFTAPEPAIQHLHTRSGVPSALLYNLTDTIVVSVTGHVKLDGGCGGGTPLYGFQRKEGDVWTDYLLPADFQMCCGVPSAEWVQHTVSLIPAHVARPHYGQPWLPGEYRAVISLWGEKELVGPPFIVVAVQ